MTLAAPELCRYTIRRKKEPEKLEHEPHHVYFYVFCIHITYVIYIYIYIYMYIVHMNGFFGLNPWKVPSLSGAPGRHQHGAEALWGSWGSYGAKMGPDGRFPSLSLQKSIISSVYRLVKQSIWGFSNFDLVISSICYIIFSRLDSTKLMVIVDGNHLELFRTCWNY